MSGSDFLQGAFKAFAVNGCLGEPHGSISYAYLRVARTPQTDDGLERVHEQVTHVHEAASEHQLCIPLELVFADCHSGRDLEGRASLSALRSAYLSPQRQANSVVMEDISRLSRRRSHLHTLHIEMFENHIMPVYFHGAQFSANLWLRWIVGDLSISDAHVGKESI